MRLQITRPLFLMAPGLILVLLSFSLQTFAVSQHFLNNILTPHPTFVTMVNNPRSKRLELLVGHEDTLSVMDLKIEKESTITQTRIQQLLSIPEEFLSKEAPSGGFLIIGNLNRIFISKR
jgi:hypothetical protein